MSPVVYTMRVQHNGADVGHVRVRAQSIRAAYERVRNERPEHARARLICCGMKETS